MIPWGDDFGITEEMRARWAAEDAASRRAEWIVRIFIWTGLVVVLLLLYAWSSL